MERTLFWNAVDLEWKLVDFRQYYNHHRTHSSLGGETPAEVAGFAVKSQTKSEEFRWQTHCRGLYWFPATD